jgi:DNA-binding NarL/FixJ family response regulator
MKPLRVLLVEDDPSWQQAIGVILSTASEVPFEVIGVADNIEDALVLAQAEKPDLCLLDFNINGPSNGLKVGFSLLEQGYTPEQLVMVTTMSASELGEHPFGYVPKNQVATHLISTLTERLVLMGSL